MLTKQVSTLEQRIERLESHVDRELGKIRSEMKEFLDLTLELIRSGEKMDLKRKTEEDHE
jgi:hypothetical protein